MNPPGSPDAALPAGHAEPAVERDAPSLLRREVKLLEATLLRVLEEDGGPELVADVERLRSATIALRAEPRDEYRRAVVELVARLDLERAERLARAFTIYFQLVNLAEDHHRVIDLRRQGREEQPLHESIAAAVDTVREWDGDEALRAMLDRLEVTPVLTAHPTEARRRAVAEALERIGLLIAGHDEQRLSLEEEAEIERRLLEEVATLWKTDQLRSARPSPLDEVRAVMALFDETIFRVAPAVYRALDRALDPDTAGLREPPFPAFLRWGSWVGGDRDGNPNVTPAITREAVDIQAEHVLHGLENVARRVSRALGPSERDVPVSAELAALLDSEEHVFPQAAKALHVRMPDQPHRRMLVLIAERIVATREGDEGAYADPDDLLAELRLVQRSLADAGAPRLAYGELQHLVWQVQTFGFHLASLEVREHADVHRRVLERLIPGMAMDPWELNRVATQGWPDEAAALAEDDDESARVMATLRTMHEIQQRYGVRACRRYVVSFTRSAADVAAVRALARLAVPDGSLSLDVVPLFESREELEHAPRILDELFELPGAAAWLKARGRRLEIMLGYSDSAKEVGVLAANLVLHRTQADLAEWASERDVKLTIFHGRGGAVGRGGGPTNRAIWGQAPGSVAGRFKVTEQGEITFARYANVDIAQRHLEQVTNAVLLASTERHESTRPGLVRFLEPAKTMATAGEVAYRELIELPGFVEFFVAATPIDEIGQLPLGSRPARRQGQGEDVESLRAIPWVFAWAQARVNLPGWFGLGSGLAAIADDPDAGGLEMLRTMYREWPFFTSLLENAELSLLKADMPIAELHFALGERPDIAEVITAEFDRTHELVLAVTEHEKLLQEQPRIQRDIELRNPYIDALSFLQVRFLDDLRTVTDTEHRAQLLRLVQITVNGVAAGLQNTG